MQRLRLLAAAVGNAAIKRMLCDAAMKRGRRCRWRDKARTTTLPLSVRCCQRHCNEAGAPLSATRQGEDGDTAMKQALLPVTLQ